MCTQRHWPNSTRYILIEAARSSFLPLFKITVLSPHLYNICFLFTNTTTRQSTHNTKVEERRRKRERERERERAQINVDAKRSSSSNLPKRRRYCTLPCFQGYFSLSLSLSRKFLYKHAFTTCLVQRCKSSTKKNKNMNSITHIDTNWP